jgi:catechol 2,3-dioxygenase-like lactoylglutathione lyase family enzyme
MIDHIRIRVSHLARATDFYSKALAPLGIGIVQGSPPRRPPAAMWYSAAVKNASSGLPRGKA